MIIGYARVSTTEQNHDLQRDALKRAGCEKIIEDTVSGGKVRRSGFSSITEFLEDVMPDQSLNAGNEGDVMKHPPLHKVVEHRCNGQDEFWYVETHTGDPYHFLLPNKGTWKGGIRHLAQNQAAAPKLLSDFVAAAFHDEQAVHELFPDKRTYLGSAAQIFHLLRERGKRIRMTLFETKAEPAEELRRCFADQGAKTVLVRTGRDVDWVRPFLPIWWDEAIKSAGNDHLVMVVESDSYSLAPSLWENRNNRSKPDLVLVDPFELSNGQPQGIVDSLDQNLVPFICWTPLDGTTVKNWKRPGDWTFLQGGVADAHNFMFNCQQKNLTMAWFSWRKSTGQGMYGCQLTFGNVFGQQFTPASIWPFPNRLLPYVDLNNLVTNPNQQGANFQNPTTTLQTPGQTLNQRAQQITSQDKPGANWWNKYHAALWWP